jgi:hypothetical protein
MTTTVITATPSQQPPPTADMIPLPNPSATLTHEPLTYEKGFLIRGPDGMSYHVEFKNDAQKKRHDELRAILVQDKPEATINLSRGYLEKEGQIFCYFQDDPQLKRALDDLRHLYHEVLGQKYSSASWHTYAPHDRASREDAQPFQKREQSPVLKKIEFQSSDLTKPDHLREYQISQKLRKEITAHIGKLADDVDTRISLDAQSRKQQLKAAQERFEKTDALITDFHAANHPPGLPYGNEVQTLLAYRNQARDYLKRSVEKNQDKKWNQLFNKDHDEPGLQESIDQLSAEMALMLCKPRFEFDWGCMALKVKPYRSTPELFIAQLSEVIAQKGKVDEYIDQNFSLYFDFTHEDDRIALKEYITGKLVPQINKELDDPQLLAEEGKDTVTYQNRIERLAEVNKQDEIIKAYDDLLGERPLTEAMQKLADTFHPDLENIKTSMDQSSTEEIIEKMQQAVAKQNKALNQIKQDNDLRRFAPNLEALIERQQQFIYYLQNKGKGLLGKGIHRISSLSEV